MDTQTAQPRELQCVTAEELMQDPEEAITAVHWRWVWVGGARWVLFQMSGTFIVRQSRHVLLCAHRDAEQHRPAGPAGLEFRVVTASGRRAIITSADEVKMIFQRCVPNHNALKNSRALLDAMREQSDHQVGLDTAML